MQFKKTKSSMQRKNFDFILTSVLSLLLFAVLSKPKVSMEACTDAQNIFLQIIFPTLFPMMILSSLLLKSKLLHSMSQSISFIMRPLFQLSGTGCSILLFGILGGYPLGSILIARELKEGRLTLAEANRLSAYCNFSSPLFVIGTIGTGLLQSTSMGYILYVIHIISGLLTGLCFRIVSPLSKNELSYKNHKPMLNTTMIENVFENLLLTIRSTFNTLLNIGGIVILFFVILKLLYTSSFFQIFTYLVEDVLKQFKIENISVISIFSGLLEVSTGALQITSESYSIFVKGYYLSFFLSFSGLCVISQCILVLKKENIDAKHFVFGKLIHAVISFLVFGLFSNLIKNIIEKQFVLF